MEFARRTQWHLETNALSQLLEELKAQDKDFIDLTESNPTHCGFQYPPQILEALFNSANMDYHPEAFGMMHARKAVGNFIGCDPKQIVVTASTSESYGYLCRLLCNPDDKVLIPKPSYPLFQYLLELSDTQFDYYPLTYLNGTWAIDFHRLEALIDANTKAIIVVNPNNPTGSYLKKNELKQLNQICRKHNLAIISDEVFYQYPLIEGDYVSLKGNADVLTFVLDGLSKNLALPQMKLGWISVHGPEAVVTQALSRLEIIADTFLSVNTPVQNALEQWFKYGQVVKDQILERVKSNLLFLIENDFRVLCVEGGWYAIIDLGSIEEETFVLNVLKEHHILIHPGFFFDIEKPGHIVVSLLPPKEQFVKIKKLLGVKYDQTTQLG